MIGLLSLLLAPPAFAQSGPCTASHPCDVGMPCTGDNQCITGLCASSSPYLVQTCHEVPDLFDWDYCSLLGDCGAGEGDCDYSSECASGLSCTENTGLRYGQPQGLDTCEPPFSWSQCTPEHPCSPNEGDCDTHADCLGSDVLCFHNIGGSFGYPEYADVCLWIGG